MRQTLLSAFRTLTRRPGFTLTAVIVAGLGIGVSTSIFSVVNSVVLTPLAYPESQRLVYLGTTWESPMPTVASLPDFVDWQERMTSLESMEALQATSMAVAGRLGAQRLRVTRITSKLLELLGGSPFMGRTFTEQEHRTGADPVVLLSHRLWQSRWAGDPAIIGKTFRTTGVAGTNYEIVGVLPASFRIPENLWMEEPDVLVPLPVDAQAYAQSRTARSLRVIGRLAPGVTVETARKEAAALAETMSVEFPLETRFGEGHVGIGLVSLLDRTVGGTGQALLILLGATGLVLLLGCANVANLMLARVAERKRELAVRVALGAGRTQIVGQLLAESTILGLLGGAIGAAIAMLAVRALPLISPDDFPRMTEISVDLRVLAFAVVLGLLTGVLFGLAPALIGSRPIARPTHGRLRKALIVTETMLAVLLLAGASLLLGGYFQLQRVDVGFDSENLVLTEIRLDDSYETDDRRAAYFAEALTQVGAVPGVKSVSAIPDPPISGYVMWGPNLYREGYDVEDAMAVGTHLIGPSYFETMGIQVLAGRGFTSRDAAGSLPVLVVSESAARHLWPDDSPIGKRVKLARDPETTWRTVIGMVGDIRQNDLATAVQPAAYAPYAQLAWFHTMYVIARTEIDAATMVAPIRRAIRKVDANVPFDGVSTMDSRIDATLSTPRFHSYLLVLFAVMSLLIAASGIYATMLHSVRQRTREFAIRIALGARTTSVVFLVIRESMLLTGIGIAAGLAGAAALSRVIASLVYGVGGLDPLAGAVAVAAILIAALLACVVPALRATRVDPNRLLRSE